MRNANIFEEAFKTESEKAKDLLVQSTPELKNLRTSQQMIQKSSLKKKLGVIEEVPNSPNIDCNNRVNSLALSERAKNFENSKNEPDLSPRVQLIETGSTLREKFQKEE
jgi:hypothetical protein